MSRVGLRRGNLCGLQPGACSGRSERAAVGSVCLFLSVTPRERAGTNGALVMIAGLHSWVMGVSNFRNSKHSVGRDRRSLGRRVGVPFDY
jgi:hypothetical protein